MFAVSESSRDDAIERATVQNYRPLGVTDMASHPLKGSKRAPYRGARATAKADPAARIMVTVLVRRKEADTLQQTANYAGSTRGNHISREDYAIRFGAKPDAVAAVRVFAAAQGLTIVEEYLPRRTVKLACTVAQFESAFGVNLQRFDYPEGSYRGRTGEIQLPDELAGFVDAVLGLDNRPQADPHNRKRLGSPPADGLTPATGSPSFRPDTIAAMYNFPAGTGQNQCIGLIELGGGYVSADLETYFGNLGIPAPTVSMVSVDNGANTLTGDASAADCEVMMDIEIVGAIAPASNIVVYFAGSTDASFLNAVTTAIHDTENRPSVISISWGQSESEWDEQTMTAFDEAFQAAATMGITICVATGDHGSSDGESDGGDHADFPASSNYALACGGTSIAGNSGSIESETVWNDSEGASGGGVSVFFDLPAWRNELRATTAGNASNQLQKRGVPDVSGNADPETGYAVRVDGQDLTLGGTSAVAPLWAGLIARINANNGSPAGYINQRLYPSAGSFRDIVSGNNGTFYASPGWDACTGLGSPDGQRLQDIL